MGGKQFLATVAREGGLQGPSRATSRPQQRSELEQSPEPSLPSLWHPPPLQHPEPSSPFSQRARAQHRFPAPSRCPRAPRPADTGVSHSPQSADEAIDGALGVQGDDVPDVQETGHLIHGCPGPGPAPFLPKSPSRAEIPHGERGCGKPCWGVTPAGSGGSGTAATAPHNFTCAERGGSPGSREEEEEEEEGRWGDENQLEVCMRSVRLSVAPSLPSSLPAANGERSGSPAPTSMQIVLAWEGNRSCRGEGGAQKEAPPSAPRLPPRGAGGAAYPGPLRRPRLGTRTRPEPSPLPGLPPSRAAPGCRVPAPQAGQSPVAAPSGSLQLAGKALGARGGSPQPHLPSSSKSKWLTQPGCVRSPCTFLRWQGEPEAPCSPNQPLSH